MGSPIYLVNEVLFIYHTLLTLHIYAIYKIFNMHIRNIQYILHIRYIIHISWWFFSIFRTQPGIELGHPRTLSPDDVIRNTIGHVSSTIYVANEVLFIYHSLLTLHIYAICKIYIEYAYKIYTIYITYKIYNTCIRCVLFSFFFFQDQTWY